MEHKEGVCDDEWDTGECDDKGALGGFMIIMGHAVCDDEETQGGVI